LGYLPIDPNTRRPLSDNRNGSVKKKVLICCK
jgi:hypothetical protein